MQEAVLLAETVAAVEASKSTTAAEEVRTENYMCVCLVCGLSYMYNVYRCI